MTITKEGALASFYTMNKAPIKHLKVYFGPKQAGEGDPSPENVREISGWDGVDVYHTKTNLFSYDVSYKEPSNIALYNTNNRVFTPYTYAYGASYSNWWNPNAVISCTVDRNEIKVTTNRSDYGVGFAMPVKGGKTLYITYTNNNNIGRTYLAFYDNTGEYITGGQHQSNQSRIIPENAIIAIFIFSSTNKEEAVFTDVSVTYENTFFYEPYLGQTHNIDWTNDIGTVYGGYVDLVTGELVKTHVRFRVPSNDVRGGAGDFVNNTSYQGENHTHRYFYLGTYQIDTSEDPISNYLVKGNCGTTAWKYGFDGVQLLHYSLDNETIGVTSETSAEDRNTAVTNWITNNPIYICYKLKNPITYNLSSATLSTLIGRNNIWSNADRVEVEYDLAESNDELYRRRNILLRSAPHVETVSGSLAHFETDLVAPLKECKVYFNPVQEGEGDPSLSNVREINGWNSITGFRTNKNIAEFMKTEFIYNNDSSMYNGYVGWCLPVKIPDRTKTYTYSIYIDNTNGNLVAQARIWHRDSTNSSYVDNTLTTGNEIPVGSKGWSTVIFNAANKPNTYYMAPGFQAKGNVIISNPTIELGDARTEYEPYFGETIPASFPVVNNLLDNISSTSNTTLNGTDGSTFSESGMAVTEYIPVKENEVYKFSFVSTEGARTRRIFGYDNNKDSVSSLASASWVTVGTSDTLTATIPSRVSFIRVCYFKNDTDKVLEGPDAHTLYGGYVDLIKGEVVQEYYSIPSSSWNFMRQNNGFKAYASYGNPNAVFLGKWYCNKVNAYGSFNSQNMNKNIIQKCNTSPGGVSTTYIALDENEDISTVQVVYNMNTPIHYPIDPITLKTLRGQNNIWSNANGDISIKYWTH